MKFLFDLFPIILFFGVFKWGEGHKEAAHGIVAQYMSGLIAGGAVNADHAPIMLATVTVIVATALQIIYVKLRGRKVDGMLWISAGVITVLGALTIYFHNENFIKWKPTMLYWAFALALIIGQFGFRKNLMRKAMGQAIKLPDAVWTRVNLAWMAFLFGLGLLNLLVAFVVFDGNTSSWVSFKTFVMPAIFFAFIIGQSVLLAKYIQEEEA
jgi:intracellular septation protein